MWSIIVKGRSGRGVESTVGRRRTAARVLAQLNVREGFVRDGGWSVLIRRPVESGGRGAFYGRVPDAVMAIPSVLI